MLSTFPTLGIRFDIGKIYDPTYGISAWEVFWGCVSPSDVPASNLLEGDTAATLRGSENVYCIAVQASSRTVIDTIMSRLDASPEFARVAATPKYMWDESIHREPLSDAGQINAAGLLTTMTSNCSKAYGYVQQERCKASPEERHKEELRHEEERRREELRHEEERRREELRHEEERRREDKRSRKKQRDEARIRELQSKRRAAKQCVNCGRPLGFLNRIVGRTHHPACRTIQG